MESDGTFQEKVRKLFVIVVLKPEEKDHLIASPYTMRKTIKSYMRMIRRHELEQRSKDQLQVHGFLLQMTGSSFQKAMTIRVAGMYRRTKCLC